MQDKASRTQMRFSPSFLDEIRDRVPISSVIGARVTWDRRKTNAPRGDYWACCPFHGEKSPSFHCEDKKGRYYCFGCGVSGDHFRFLTDHDGLAFPEAVERIADMAGVPMPARDVQQEQRERERASLSDVMEMATQFFQDRLQGADGAKARAYLRERGLSGPTQQKFRLGYAPESRNALKEHLAAKGVDKGQIEACGLVVHGPDIPLSYDRFRDRIMFPIEDARGRVIAFGGRAMAADAPAKYLNSNDTELFHKGQVLYNLARARSTVARGGTIIAVEGYMDVIALAQAGVENAVAPLGTALTENQLELLWRMSGEPVLCFDGDQAGMKAAFRAADLALPLVQAGRTLRFALLPNGQDPDDLVKAEGPDAFRAIVTEARPLADMLWQRETGGSTFDTPERRAELEKRLRELTFQIKDEDVRRHYQQEMRDRVIRFFGASRPQNPRFEKVGGQGRPGMPGQMGKQRFAVSETLARSSMVRRAATAMPLRETSILVTLVNHPDLVDEYFDEIDRLSITSAELRQLKACIVDAAAHGLTARAGTLIEHVRTCGIEDIWERALLQVKGAGLWTALPEAALDDARDAFQQALYLQQAAQSLHRELKAAETALATEPTDENYRHLVDVQSQLRDVQATEALIEGFGVQSGRAGRA
jgi:DNA primase